MDQKKKKLMRKQGGFTLIEILVVIGLIAVLAGIVLVAINPARQFAQGRDAQRHSNLNAILNAIGQRIADNKGMFPSVPGCDVLATGVAYTIAVGASAASVISPIDLSCLTPMYIPAQLPVDPTVGIWNSATDYNTGYGVLVDTTGRYTVVASTSEPSVPRDGTLPSGVIKITR